MKRIASIFFAALTAISCNAQTQPTSDDDEFTWADALGAEITDEWRGEKHRAFDFWIGEWEMNWRAPVAGAFEHEVEGSWTHERVFPILGGKAIVELGWERDTPDEPSQRGFSIRYYDTEKEHWVMAQNWPNATNQGGAFLDQLVGREHLGRLTMYSATRRPKGDGTFADEHRRYNFADIRPGKTIRWDGSNTPDKGVTWHTWYVVDSHRRRDLDPHGAAGTAFPGVHQEVLCTDEPHGAYDNLQGVWQGTATDADGAISMVRMSAGKLLDGCGVATVLETDAVRTFRAFGYHPRLEQWVVYHLDDRPGTAHAYFVSKSAGEGASFEESALASIQDETTPFVVEESFDTSAALRRTSWTAMSDSEIVFQEETRESPQSEWFVAADYRLTRNE